MNYIKIDWIQVFYKEFHSPSNKGTILILHWWGGSSQSWEYIWNKLSENWYNVYIPDLPGFGETPLNKVFTIHDYAEVVESFVNILWLKNITLLWHSNWWRISIHVIARKNISINKLILNNAAWVTIYPSFKQKAFQWISTVVKFASHLPWYQPFRKLCYRLIWGHDYINTDNNPYLKETFLNMLGTFLEHEMANINIPCLLIRGEKDSYTPLQQGYTMNKLIPGSSLKVLDWEKHWIHLQNPDRLLSEIISFL